MPQPQLVRERVVEVISEAHGSSLAPAIADRVADQIDEIFSEQSDERLRALRMAQVFLADSLMYAKLDLRRGIGIRTELAAILEELYVEPQIREHLDDTELRRIEALIAKHKSEMKRVHDQSDLLQERPLVGDGGREGRLYGFANDIGVSLACLALTAGAILIFFKLGFAYLGGFVPILGVVFGLALAAFLLTGSRFLQRDISDSVFEEIADQAIRKSP